MPKVGGSVEEDFVFVGEGDGHDPAAAGGVPEDVGVAEVRHFQVEDGICGEFGPGAAPVVAPGEVLGLQCGAGAGFGRVPCVDGDETGLAIGAEAARVVLIHNGRAGEDHDSVFLRKGDGEFLPVEQIGADGVAPAHVAPGVALGIVLVKEVVLAVEPDEAVRVIGPVGLRGEVELRAEGLVVLSASEEAGQREERERFQHSNIISGGRS